MSLNNRQWNQIRAALTFWRAVAESSRVHPIKHPAVQPYFGDEQPTPLTEDEIDDLIAWVSLPAGPAHSILSSVARRHHISVAWLRAEIKRRGVEPLVKIGNTYFYDREVLVAAARMIRNQDGAFRRKYHVPDPTP